MIITKSENLYLEMTAKLIEKGKEKLTDVSRLASSLEIIASHINRVSTLVDTIGFSSPLEEIHFFKNIKPKFYSRRIFLVEQFNIISNIPEDTTTKILAYYKKEISFIRRYFNQNKLIYQYYLSDESALDAKYFLRNNRLSTFPALNFPESETNGDYFFAKFLAFEELRRFLIDRMRIVEDECNRLVMNKITSVTTQRWTDDKVNLVELAYGLYFMGSINNGNADILEIVALLEDSFKIELGGVYRSFVDISRRKTLSYTKYLDAMRNEISRHINRKHSLGK